MADSQQIQTNPIHDGVAAVSILILCAGVWWQTERIQPASAMFPRLVGAIAAGLAVIYLVRAIHRIRLQADRPYFFINLPRWLGAFGLIAGYALVFPLVGFIAATLVFIPLTVMLAGVRRPLFTAVVTVVFTFSAYGLFVVALRRYLPPELILQWLP